MITTNGNQVRTVRGSIAGIVAAVPRDRVTNDELGPDAHAAAKITGVQERRHAPDTVTTEDLCLSAAQRLLWRLDWDPATIDTLVYVTQTPRLAVPSSGYELQEVLGLPKHCIVIEPNWSCCGYVAGLWLAMAQRGDHNDISRTLLLVGDVTSHIADPGDRATWPLFGDAGSATAIEHSMFGDPQAHFFLGSDGAGADKLVQHRGDFLRMDGSEVFNFTLRTVPGLVDDVLMAGQPDFVLMHQANRFMLQHLVKKSQLRERAPAALIPTNIDRFGNCSSASIPLLWASDVGAKAGRYALLGYGAGWSWAGASIAAEPRVVELVEV